jgi:energy-coupling factor transporter ATP-binding protein EcfA2
VQHTRIGDEKTRGVSGGQRKRVNIGIEVSACPVALYLDEPTSGLDSTAALEVTNSLKHIAHSTGITVAMVIHQPRYEIWAALDEVLFLAPGGRTVYLGNLAAVQDYFFNQLGYMPTERDNPADFYMDRIAESGDVCVKAWADHVSSGHASRLSRADSTPPGGIAPPWSGVGGNSGSVSAPLLHVSEDLDTSGGGLRMTIGSGVNSRLHHFTDHGKTMKAKDLERALEDAGVFGDLKVQANLLIEAYDTEGAGTLKGDDLEKLVAQIDKDERGAPFWKQCAMAHTRSVVQQLNNPVAIAIELGTVSLAGALMGFAAKNPYTGILVAPYTLLSPANQVVLVPMSAMFTGGLKKEKKMTEQLSEQLSERKSPSQEKEEPSKCNFNFLSFFFYGSCFSLSGMAVGLSAAPTGVNSFGSELVVYWREASVGHSQLAYFLGKTVSNFYRILIGALHFCAWYLLLAETILSPSQLYGVVVVLFFSVYGMACIISMLMPIDTANLVAVVLALLVPVFGGFVRNLGIGVKKTMYSWWANEAFFSYSIEPYKHLFYVDMTSDVWSYTLYQTEKDLLVVVLIGILCRIVAFFCMTGLNREKQS